MTIRSAKNLSRKNHRARETFLNGRYSPGTLSVIRKICGKLFGGTRSVGCGRGDGVTRPETRREPGGITARP